MIDMEAPAALIPEITDDDVAWICGLMKLDAVDEHRIAFLKDTSTIDVAACPGSGKTTLIVAKLAILARKWPHRARGVCVLSHTNVAREEIEKRLGNTVVGHRLLGYPHFVDTIHGFANRFLALPWLAANGIIAPTIDDDLTSDYRARSLGVADFRKTEFALKQKYKSWNQIRIKDRSINFGVGQGDFPFGKDAASFKFTKSAVEAAAVAGYFCHDEMFVWANALLEDFPDATQALQERFPLVLIDEMQDTSSLQSKVLASVFPRNSEKISVQRIGDPNQRIFGGDTEDEEADDTFPVDGELQIPNSFRFGVDIAKFSSPLAVNPIGDNGLVGIRREDAAEAEGPPIHTIFVFPDNATDGVLDAFGRHVIEVLPPKLCEAGKITAVGGRHRADEPAKPGDNKYPQTVGDYWSGYSVESSKRTTYPKTFLQHLRIAQSESLIDLAPGVERLAAGVVRMTNLFGEVEEIKHSRRKHRAILRMLADQDEALTAYRSLIIEVLVERVPLEEQSWDKFLERGLTIAQTLSASETPIDDDATRRFIAWNDAAPVAAADVPLGTNPPLRENSYRVTHNERFVDIDLSSIHAIKGETHLATLVLSTFWKKHSFERLMGWLTGERCNADRKTGVEDQKRMLQTFVAMTRPTHLLCLAIRRSSFGDEEAFAKQCDLLRGRGWNIVDLTAAL